MSLLPSGFARRRSEMMKRVMTILATALLASGVLATAAEAGGDGYMGGLWWPRSHARRISAAP